MENTTLAFTNCTIEDARNGSCTNYTYTYHYVYKRVLTDVARTYFTFFLVWSWLLTVLIVSLNLTVIVLICSYKKRSRLYFFLLNLAIADLATGLLSALPGAVEKSLGLEYFVPFWMAGEAFCKIQRTLAKTCIVTSNYILAVMSLDRAYAICKPMMSMQKGSVLQKVSVISCWVFCFICCSPFLKYYEATYYGNYFSFGDKQTCMLYFGDTYEDIIEGQTVKVYLEFVFMFLIPLFFIVGSFTLLVVFIYRRALKQTPKHPVTFISDTDYSRGTRVFNKGMPKSKRKSIKLTLGIVLSFLICWIAYFIGWFLAIYTSVNHPLLIIPITFYYGSSIANPVLFFIYHRKKKVRAASRHPRPSTETPVTFISSRPQILV